MRESLLYCQIVYELFFSFGSFADHFVLLTGTTCKMTRNTLCLCSLWAQNHSNEPRFENRFAFRIFLFFELRISLNLWGNHFLLLMSMNERMEENILQTLLLLFFVFNNVLCYFGILWSISYGNLYRYSKTCLSMH